MQKHLRLLGFLLLIAMTFSSSKSYGMDDGDDQQYQKALDLMKRLKRNEAKELFSEIIDRNPEHAGSLYQRALIHLHFKEYESALTDFTKVTHLTSEYKIRAHFEIGLIKVKKGDYKGSIIDFTHVIHEDERNARAYYLRGQSKYNTKEYESALIDFKKAIEITPKDPKLHYDKGLTEMDLEDYDTAIEDFTKALDLDKTFSDAYFNRANCYFLEGVDPEYHHHKKLMQKALEDYNQALKLNPELEAAYFDRGEVKMTLHDYVGAISDFKHAIQLDPNDLDAHYLKAMCNYHYGYEEAAMDELNNILARDSTYENAEYQVGVIHYEWEEYGKALEIFDRLIKQEADHEQADTFIYRGLTLLEMGRNDLACKDFHKADELGDREAHLDIKKWCKIDGFNSPLSLAHCTGLQFPKKSPIIRVSGCSL